MKITKEDIEKQLGMEVQSIKIEPLYENGECIGLNILVQPIKTAEHINVDFKISPSSDFYKIEPDEDLLDLQEEMKNKGK